MTEDVAVEKVQLVFPKPEASSRTMLTAIKPDIDFGKFVTVGLDELLNWFKSYKLDSIEVDISGTVQTGKIISLIVSATGTGGVKVVFKPK
jgi:hypothetical protein